MADPITDTTPPPPPEKPSAPPVTAQATRAAERHVRALVAVPGIPVGEEGWIKNDERGAAMIERGLVEEIS